MLLLPYSLRMPFQSFCPHSPRLNAYKSVHGYHCRWGSTRETSLPGDFETQNARRDGGKSTFETKYFEDENFEILHDKKGILGMDNYGWENTNSSRFYVTFRETPWMNNFHVAFGELVEGFDVLDSIEKLGILEGNGPQQGRTKEKIVISDCGLYEK
ncbi:hypothetical protein GCK72_020057 [Caenorhabditis remanei]|uniref:PPIase cyclophilin-type domain-containing protein n=1 Tax=Caenorhabditis remanei TaxID=31234 RepID=A0A6A5GEH2_CAERE|nr:hypothetical protein GCK72_020057 [Caenorhabditis remanei]KAF1753500.1 hypothetical protein GCK72_020057 [Caenorhabditis remanei]